MNVAAKLRHRLEMERTMRMIILVFSLLLAACGSKPSADQGYGADPQLPSPNAGLLPTDVAARAHCRAICGEMHSGFSSLRSALPMNLKGDFPGHKVWARALGDIDRITAIWRDCIDRYGGPFLFGDKPCMADAMYAPVATRFMTYHVKLDRVAILYCQQIMSMPEMKAWVSAAKQEKEDIEEFDMEF